MSTRMSPPRLGRGGQPARQKGSRSGMTDIFDLIAMGRTNTEIYTDEIFGPVLVVVRAPTLDDAIKPSTATTSPTAPRSSPGQAGRRASSSARCRSG
jgi:hypothetical protein